MYLTYTTLQHRRGLDKSQEYLVGHGEGHPLIPASIRFPPAVVLAKPVEQIPAPSALPGGSRYEPKWDGFRAVIVCDAVVSIWSRQGKDLTVAFPELVEAAGEQLPKGALFDGEIVAWRDGRLAFEDLQGRAGAGVNTARRLARAVPASFVVFDMLALDSRDVRSLRYDDRRELLESLEPEWGPPFALSPMTRDPDVAAGWFVDMAAAGLEGLVVKGGDQPYEPGTRAWMKVKRRVTVDVVVAAVIGPIGRPQAIVAGLIVDGVLRVAGQSAPLRPDQAAHLAPFLSPPVSTHPWPSVLPALGRFRSRREDVPVTLVEPVVAEVSADSARSGSSFRHLVRFVRVRPELSWQNLRSP